MLIVGMSYNTMHLLSKQLKPLLRTPNTLPVIQNCRDDYYVSVPFRTKDSIYYRNLVKTMGGRYDPISERWYIPNESFQLDDVKIIEDLRMYDGLKFKFSIQLPEFNPTLGAVGDILLADMSQYIMIDKDVQSASSIHVQFLTDQVAFRFVYRCDGQPKISAPLTPYQGAGTLSPFVALAAR